MSAKPRWTKWVAHESANPRLSMPWALNGRVRNSRVIRNSLLPV